MCVPRVETPGAGTALAESCKRDQSSDARRLQRAGVDGRHGCARYRESRKSVQRPQARRWSCGLAGRPSVRTTPEGFLLQVASFGLCLRHEESQ